ncbi:MAG: transglycosylase domain-containing protein, partial [Rhodothermales bacterium]
LLVFLDPGIPLSRRAVHGARGAGIATAAGTLALIVYTIILIPFTPPLSTIRQLGNQHPAVVLDIRGDVITRYRRVNREWVELHEVSPYFLNALLTVEDRRFYDHFGIDVPRIVAAGLRTLTGDLQGGSTISQQLARNLFPERIGRSISLDRKLKEAVTALKIEAIYTKAEILESYINTVPFLFNTVGVEMAARTYFGKPALDLDVVESATLVGMLKGTYSYNPVRNPERALLRRNLILAQMTRHGSVSIDDYGDLISRPLDLQFEVKPIRESRAPHFTEFVRRWLVSWADQNGFNIYTDSLLVYTTLDLKMQDLAAEAIKNQGEALQAVADVEWSQRSFGLRSTNPYSYLNRRRNDAFAYFWASRDSLVNGYIKATPHYRLMRENGVEMAAALDSLRADRDFTDSLRQEKTRLEAGFLAIAPRIGHVKAWVGSRDFESDEFDHVSQARRQAGSTFKPFLYAAAIESGFSPDDRFTDQPVTIRLDSRRVWRPQNAGEFSFRSMTLRDALAHSVNTISAQLVERVGPERVADMARRAGVESDLDVVPSIALGTSAVSLREMVTAFSTLASGGIYHEPVTVLRIEDRRGNVLYEADDVRREVISESVASTV